MIQPSGRRPQYGNWVSMKLIAVPGVISALLLAAAIPVPFLLVVAIPFACVSLYFACARYLFSPHGGNVQEQVRGLVLSHLDWDGEGRVLDIGCGSGALTIDLAKTYPKARVVGIDYWGKKWEYSQEAYEENAAIEGVADRVPFQRAGAAALPFDDNSMDLVVSNLVFHEVGGVKDKREVIREALRVVKKGGTFVFQDLFMWKQIYGESDALVETIRSWGIKEVKLVNTGTSAFIPGMLKLPFMVGTIGIIAGVK